MMHDDKFSDHPPSPDGATSRHVIHIEELEIFARVGVPEEERAAEQRLVFNLTFWPTHPEPALEDDVARTVDYSAVCAETKRFVKARSDRLIETLADALARRLLDMFAIEKITIELRKFILPEVKFVSVTVTRARAARVRKTQIPSDLAIEGPNPKLQSPKKSQKSKIPNSKRKRRSTLDH